MPITAPRPAFAWLPGGIVTVALLAIAALFLALPGTIATKAHIALHGLCAQTPGHTFAVGGLPLPLDARMMGIYGGFAVAAAWLVARRRLAAAALPRWPVGLVLVGGIAVMGVDGTNSLLRDLGLPYGYEPHNLLRVATGALAGVSLAAALCWLVASTLWRTPRQHEAAIGSLGEWVRVALAAVGLVFLVPLAPGWAYGVVAGALVMAGLLVVATIALVALLMIRRQEGLYGTFVEARRPALSALVTGVLAMAMISGGRLALEWWSGLPLPIH
ncbi:MAG TPA: DUF2085 domain-containing protein [Thermomicrobiales bacterium]|jgi:uncharacterized membrane protein|nr:DUF2085 domain-containing protein [Thermomicrobiales bacterium]